MNNYYTLEEIKQAYGVKYVEVIGGLAQVKEKSGTCHYFEKVDGYYVEVPMVSGTGLKTDINSKFFATVSEGE